MGKTPSAADILNFWFVETTPEFWFKKDDDFDAAIQERFGKPSLKRLPEGLTIGPMTPMAVLRLS